MNKEEIKNTTYNPKLEGNIMKDNRSLQTQLTEANEKLEKIKEYINSGVVDDSIAIKTINEIIYGESI